VSGAATVSVDRKKLAWIHIVKRELGLSDQTYRDTLETVAGVRSAKDLDEAGFHKLMRYFVRSEHYRTRPGGMTFRQKIFIGRLKERLRWEDDHFRNFLLKYYHKADLTAFSRKDAAKLIESLKNVLQHQRGMSPAHCARATGPE
jgi:hypothetical protein